MIAGQTTHKASIRTAVGNRKRFSFLLWQPPQLCFTFIGGMLEADSKSGARKLRTHARF
jgi:hypothetical protein